MSGQAPIVVVSGLPRSGTSLMMQMLVAGGLESVTDGQREADDSNPRGYYEFEPVKKLKQDTQWVADARGRVVKVISQLLFDLPPSESYNVIFMQRPLEEVLNSQEKMMAAMGQPAPPRAIVQTAFEKHLQKIDRWIATNSNFKCLRINYPQLIANPVELTQEINAFLGGELALEPMTAAVDPTLYRNRA